MDFRRPSERFLSWLETSPALRRLDRVPFPLALVSGLILGLLAGTTTLGLDEGVSFAVAWLAIALAAIVAWSAQPAGIWPKDKPAGPPLDMVAVEGGSFWMGSPGYEIGRYADEVRRRVTVSDFLMSRTVVTRSQYLEVMGADNPAGPGGVDHPATQVSWFDAVAFCNRLSELENLTLCYRIDGRQVVWVADSGGYRLPTEAEWEYAARAGSKGRWPFSRRNLKFYAWFALNSNDHSRPVAKLRPNYWGLYDMHGNVLEWCWDRFSDYELRPTLRDPRGSDAGSSRILRGGAFFGEAWSLRSAYREGRAPSEMDPAFGFRYVCRARRQM